MTWISDMIPCTSILTPSQSFEFVQLELRWLREIMCGEWRGHFSTPKVVNSDSATLSASSRTSAGIWFWELWKILKVAFRNHDHLNSGASTSRGERPVGMYSNQGCRLLATGIIIGWMVIIFYNIEYEVCTISSFSFGYEMYNFHISKLKILFYMACNW